MASNAKLVFPLDAVDGTEGYMSVGLDEDGDVVFDDSISGADLTIKADDWHTVAAFVSAAMAHQ